MTTIMKQLRPAIVALVILTIITGVLYPLAVTGIAQVVFPYQANGSIILSKDGRPRGSALIGQQFDDPKYFWGRPSATVPAPYTAFNPDTLTGSSGSGVIMSPDGYIVTNHHVVERSTEIKVTLADKREYKAKLIGSDPSTDVTLIKIEENNLPFIVFGNSDSVRIGEWVLAVGNPFNLESTVTAGIISAKGRNINILGGGASIESFIQTDAAVNPGNSGGALVNTAGELIGINTAIITESGSYEGYSFAVPSNLVQKVIRDLREFGHVQRAYLGVSIQDLDSETAREVGLPNAEGVYVNRVTSNGAAQDAGLKIGVHAVAQGRISLTPLQLDLTRYAQMDLVENWFRR